MNLLNLFRRPKPIIFVGARMAIDMVQHVAEDCGYKVVGILDKYYYGNTKDIKGIPVIGSEDWLLDTKNKQAQKWLKTHSFALTSWWDGRQFLGRQGTDNEALRLERANLLEKVNANCPVLIHPSVKFRGRKEKVTIGKGTIIEADCTFGPNISIGNFCYLDWCVSMYTNVHLHNNVIVGAKANLGEATVKNNCRIGVATLTAPIGLRQNDHITVGENSVVWMGCHAYKNIPDNHVWTKGDKIITRYKKTDET
jgi:carbonic anhydrase/acetyltransferase-like protein (isoleucine patch superfamily)